MTFTPPPDLMPRVFTADEVAPIVVPTVKESLTVPAGSMVKRVAAAIDHANKTGDTDARAAILEVSAWLAAQSNSITGQAWAEQLRIEAES